jgi:RHH-type transcriptional regulator, rel operon repressor / antitoxin RelB
MQRQEPFVPLSTRVSPAALEKLENLSEATGRTKSFLTSEAIERYVEVQAWQLKEIKEALKMADSKGARFIDHKRVCEWISSWGTKNEKKRPR